MLNAVFIVAIAIFCLSTQAAETVNYADFYDVKEAVPTTPSTPVQAVKETIISTPAQPSAEAAATSTPASAPSPSNGDKLQELDYNQVQTTEGTEIQKGLEFAVSKELSNTSNATEISVKNEYPESLKVVFEAIGENLEIYLNAYELLDKVALNKNSEYKIRVYNVYGDYLGYIRSPATLIGQLQISPFLLVRDSIIEAPTVKFVKEDKPATIQSSPETSPTSKPQENLTEKQEATQPQITTDLLKSVELKDEFAAEKKSMIPLEKRPIRVANISKAQVHIDIVEADNQAIGEGWTIANDIYEPQFLNLKSEPIQISAEADLQVTQAISQTSIKRKAKELNIDEKGNYVWLIDNLTLSSSQ